jgi:hypothetical protein
MACRGQLLCCKMKINQFVVNSYFKMIQKTITIHIMRLYYVLMHWVNLKTTGVPLSFFKIGHGYSIAPFKLFTVFLSM